MNKSFRPSHIVAALWIACAVQMPVATAADLTAAVPSGSGFVVKNADGTQDRFRVQENGVVTIPALSGGTPNSTPACFDAATGRLGPCAAGVVGPGAPAAICPYANFFALMPPDNAATVAPGTDVSFPQDGPASASGIARTGASTFNLASVGTYQVMFQVSVSEAGQLMLTLDGADLAYTVVGRATGTAQLVGMAMVQTTTVNTILTVRNPAGNSTALTITPLAGGTRPVSAHLLVQQIGDCATPPG